MINEQIKDKEIRVIDSNGEQIGIMPIKKALKLAQEKQLDLVKVAPQAKPPVCRIMDYGKYKYEQSKKEKEARKKQKIINIKEIRMSPKIEEHDFQVRVRNAQRFINDGDKVKVTIRFRGREIAHTDLGQEVLEKMAEELRDIAIVEKKPKVEGKNMVMILSPKQEQQ
ncbi:Translation initiation factor IF-3 [Koleobacter methoxysyntrophicus]|uniref:Translation initiation factor IF-3 n=1 Tax=Koleobacter methoxysyntrophicus TaxID=2751313 RepID=A0A8A0RR01_9FIRM|nr:translation initiation factor IF-3 [Koleobacter methoxysyntrophicus]MDI3540476.1 translation initiation factor [Thermosediminibacterales bacterium]MDK2901689.1 translation initiation factor [Thermosediminibacterales bacterium]QSQ09949.1 Translation initiation factor IF-3 [Koleobacter methoxysyntrophicus]